MKHRLGIDIIVPVYNAFDDLRLCIQSIKKYTDLKANRLILVNDKSTDERIRPYLEKQKSDNILVLNNESNLGFSGSVNRGISLSTRDVILLNSDTIVTKNWIEKIVRCAYSSPEIATVTPFSNSATICSIPNFCQDNQMPDNINIDEFADLVEKCSLRQYPQIPVAVGFCMFIKREVIDLVGSFDQQTFEKGYGEENDFCFRAEQMGYIHVLCDDTFIYHKGSTSFSSWEKLELIRKHEKILAERYPKQVRENQRFCAQDKNYLLRDNINLYLSLHNGKKNVLYVLHYDFCAEASHNIGGTQLHVKDLVINLKNNYNVFVISRDMEYLRLTIYYDCNVKSLKFIIGEEKKFPLFTDRRIRDIYRNILTAFSIDIVHIHHTSSLSLDIFYEAQKLNIPIIATLHDYYYVCPMIKMLNNQNKVCIACDTTEMCKKCLKDMLGIAEGVDFIKHWREKNLKALTLCESIIVPSLSAKKIIIQYFPSLADKIRVIPHGSDLYVESLPDFEKVHITSKHKSYFESIPSTSDESDIVSGWTYIEGKDSINSKIYIEVRDESGFSLQLPCHTSHRQDVAGNNRFYIHSGFQVTIPYKLFQTGKLKIRILIENDGLVTTDGKVKFIRNKEFTNKSSFNVAFIGGMTPAKGSQIAYQMICHSPKNINWFVFGGIGDKNLKFLKRKNLIKTGWYRREDLPQLINRYHISLICILPIWPETFCYTLSEALLARVPVILTDIGAVGERAEYLKECTWKVPADATYKDVLDLIVYILNHKEEYQKKLSAVRGLHLRDSAEMAEDYKILYEKYPKRTSSFMPENPTEIMKGLVIAGQSQMTSFAFSDLADKLNKTEQKLNEIYSSTGYKALQEFRKLKIPFKQQIKAFIYKCYKILGKVKRIQ
ncbi:MAG: hypothetical protein ACFWUM_01950 [Eubacteriales bacterium]|jgi:GT2 family glycosyltransferase/glycosyltransferase involved in cell wall biosynthesis